MDKPATEWRTLTEESVPLRAHQWTFLVLTTVLKILNQNSGSVLNVVISGRILHSLRTLVKTPSMQVVFRSLKQREDAPLWESLTWERAIQPSITSNSKQEALNGGAVYLEQLWLSQVLMNTNWYSQQQFNKNFFLPISTVAPSEGLIFCNSLLYLGLENPLRIVCRLVIDH